VYGLHLAKEAIRKAKYSVIAEGNLDVIASHQAGVRQVVATAGTALTEYQLKALGRFTPDVRLSFDADNAGLNATERSIPIASKVGVSLSVISIPSGKDPDELIKQDPGKWQQIIEKPQYALDWLIQRYQKQLDIDSAQGKRQFSDIILSVVKGLNDQVEQEHYLEKVGKLIGVSREALVSKLSQKSETVRLKPKKTQNKLPDKVSLEMIKAENHLLALALLQPKLRDYLTDVKPQMLAEEQAGKLLTFLQEHPDFDGSVSQVAPLRPLADYVKMLSLLFEELYQDLEFTDLRYEATQLQVSLVRIYVRNQKQRISHELQTSDEARTTQLLEADKKLTNLLKKYKGGN
jgi:DNA primase